jgi:hypothetical protein
MPIELDRVFFDMETYSPGERPQFTDKIIAIGITDLDGKLTLTKEWEESEKQILEGAYQRFINLSQIKNPRRKFIGYNILGFDLPLFISRALALGIDNIESLCAVIYRLEIVDLMQCLLPYNSFRYSGLNANKVSNVFGLSPIQHSSKDLYKFYEAKNYSAIEQHLESDMEFNSGLYQKMCTLAPWEISSKIKTLR